MDFNTLTNYNCDAAHLISLFIERRVRHDFINVYILRQNRIVYILRQNRIVECASIEMEKSHLHQAEGIKQFSNRTPRHDSVRS